MALPFYNWSRTAASNATADSTINWAEGQAPSSVNDSARAMMASTAAYRDDIAGAIVTGGSSTAYTITSYQIFDSVAHMSGQVIAFSPHATNGASPTLNVDGLGAIPIWSALNTPISAGVLILGTPYVVLYNLAVGAFYLRGFYGNPYNVPLGAMIDYTGSTAPNSSFVLPYGQAISRSTYSTYFSLVSTTFGTGDGSTTFNVPDLRGRVVAGLGNMGGSAASRLTATYFGADGNVTGNVGGSESHTLSIAELPAHTHANSLTDPGHTHGTAPTNPGIINNAVGGASAFGNGSQASDFVRVSSATTGITITNASVGSGNAHAIVMPTMILPKLLRII